MGTRLPPGNRPGEAGPRLCRGHRPLRLGCCLDHRRRRRSRGNADSGWAQLVVPPVRPCGDRIQASPGPSPARRPRLVISARPAPWEWRDRQSNSPRGPTETSREDRDCSDFENQSQAQRFCERYTPGDPHKGDPNNLGGDEIWAGMETSERVSRCPASNCHEQLLPAIS
jgi:hypothetical protein